MYIPLICHMAMTDRLATRTDTSDAAFTAAPGGAAALCLSALRERPRSVDELMVDLRISHSTCSAAVNKLMREGWVYDAGIRTRTRSGRNAIVWMTNERPKPIKDERPTRSQLAQQVEHLKREIEMLKGASDDVQG